MNESADLAELSARTWERTLELNPTLATVYGDERYDDRLDDPGPAGPGGPPGPRRGDARRALRAIDPAGLGRRGADHPRPAPR